MSKNTQRLAIVGVVCIALILFAFLDVGRYFTLESFALQRDQILLHYAESPVIVAVGFMAVYIACVALSFPVAAVLTLAAGAIFGLVVGTILVSFASSIGATLAFLVSRFVLRDWVQGKYHRQLGDINRGMATDGVFYLFILRMIPLFPFFLVNLVMGVTPIRALPFYLASQAGMLISTCAYVFAGTQLASIESAADILSPGLITALVVLGALPLVSRKLVERIRRRRALKGYVRPKGFDANLVIVGGGSAGLVAAIIGSTVRARTILIEKGKMGGDCLNTGCVPSKSLIRSSRIAAYIRRAGEFGLRVPSLEVDFNAVMTRVQGIISTIEPHDSMERYRELGVECISGEAELVDPYRVRVGDRVITTRAIVLANGASPAVPPIPGLDKIAYLTSDNIWSLEEMPERLLVLGGGPIGCELAQAMSRLGSRVTVVDMLDRLLPREDEEVSALLEQQFAADGIDLRLGHRAVRFEVDSAGARLLAQGSDASTEIQFDRVLIAVGRRANAQGLGEMDFEFNADGTLKVNEFLQTRFPNIYACGDVTGPYQFTHMASHQAWYATVNALFGQWWKFRVNYRVVPWATYTDPEIAHVGLNEQSAASAQLPVEITRFELAALDRAIADGEGRGFIKILTQPGSDRILGATIVGHQAGELIGEYVTAMTHGLGLNKIMNTIHIYPTMGEVNKFAATTWKRKHAPLKLLGIVGGVHDWMRGSKASEASDSTG